MPQDVVHLNELPWAFKTNVHSSFLNVLCMPIRYVFFLVCSSSVSLLIFFLVDSAVWEKDIEIPTLILDLSIFIFVLSVLNVL